MVHGNQMYFAWSVRKTVPQRTLHEVWKCSQHYPRVFSDETYHGDDGYPVYRRSDNGRTFQRSPGGFVYDNRWVVPYNPFLAKRFDAHINVKCPQESTVWYLLEYVYKGPDRNAVELDGPVNEIKRFEDARYLNPAEVCGSLLEA